ncbi:hypothetical protein GCM10022221_66690 [Actinocorallia aurea]
MRSTWASAIGLARETMRITSGVAMDGIVIRHRLTAMRSPGAYRVDVARGTTDVAQVTGGYLIPAGSGCWSGATRG